MTEPTVIDTTPSPSPLVAIVESSGLEKTKANQILEKFQGYFKIASHWESVAKTIVVSSPDQKAEMKMAREGRLELRQKRIDVEKMRRELKEQSLREGKAIDGIANVLKGLIEPIEEYLDQQERFVEIREEKMKAERETKRIAEMESIGLDTAFYDVKDMPEENYQSLVKATRKDNEARVKSQQKAESERLAKEKADAIERKRLNKENERLRKESEAKEKQMAKERAEAAARENALREKARQEREEIEAKRRASERMMKSEAEAKLNKERQERERIQSEIRAREEAEAKERKRVEKEERDAERAPDKAKLIALSVKIEAFELPVVKSAEAKSLLRSTAVSLSNMAKYLRAEAGKL
jgi:hypothetical protein